MSEEQEVVNRELGGNNSGVCTLCGVSRPKNEMILISGEQVGHTGSENVDVCVDCFKQIQRGDVEPVGDPEI